jgi:molybdopterin/thiamine biosynthesis adenylyltransferase
MEPNRYLRHSLIDWFSQDAVRGARIAVIGAGAIGNEALKNLALLGVGAADVYDLDRVEIHNLTRSIFLRENDVGASKASAVVARAAEVDPSVALRAVEGDFWDTLSLAALGRYSAVVCCVDNFEARLRLSQLCLIAGVDLVNAAIDSRHVMVETFPFAEGTLPACYECHLPPSAYERVAERYSCGWLRKAAWTERKVPTTTITASVAGALAASAALRLGGGTETGARRVFVDTVAGGSTVSRLERQSGCVGCGAFSKRPRVIAAGNDWERRVSETRGEHRTQEALVVRLSDPIVTAYGCALCGGPAAAQPYVNRRAADFDDRIMRCASCGQQSATVEIRDELTFDELLERFHGHAVPVKYALAAIGGEAVCFDFEE